MKPVRIFFFALLLLAGGSESIAQHNLTFNIGAGIPLIRYGNGNGEVRYLYASLQPMASVSATLKDEHLGFSLGWNRYNYRTESGEQHTGSADRTSIKVDAHYLSFSPFLNIIIDKRKRVHLLKLMPAIAFRLSGEELQRQNEWMAGVGESHYLSKGNLADVNYTLGLRLDRLLAAKGKWKGVISCGANFSLNKVSPSSSFNPSMLYLQLGILRR